MVQIFYFYVLTVLGKLHRDERGDNENLGRLLMLALILIPLVLLLILFGGQIYNAASEAWNNVMNSSL